MNRLLSRREKEGSSHRRQKSRDKSAHHMDKKDPGKKSVSNPFTFSTTAVFSSAHGKAQPSIQPPKFSPTVTTSTDNRFGLLLQIQPLSSEIIGLFKYDPLRKLDKEQDAKIQLMRKRLTKDGHTNIGDLQLQYGLFSKHADGDVDKAVELVNLFQDSVEGVIKKYDPTVEMKGAVNNQGVTCWLDSLLFGMFAQLPSFEPILYTIYDDEPRRRLSTLLRLWVNMLRTGMLIQTDVTCYIQEALAECGWKEAGQTEQQDTSEAFSFITDKLQLPLLTLKVDLYHYGVADAKDDHKRVYERLLDVAIPTKSEDGRTVKLEDCLENYFNNKVEVKRMLERSGSYSAKRERSNTISSMDSEKETFTHVEVAELSSPNTPISISTPESSVAPPLNRTQSIIRRRLIEDEHGESSTTDPDNASTRNSVRKQSLRNEVVIPAWQFFNLIRPLPFNQIFQILCFFPARQHVLTGGLAWFTKSTIPNDASLAAHFSQARPVLGICLKRYSFTKSGEAMKNSTYIDIPLELQFPHFVPDETTDEGPSLGNFKLSLQSIICHEGNSVHRGHYFSYIRAAEASDGDSASDRRLSNNILPPEYPMDRWITHNDLANPRVEYVDIAKVLKEKTPYLLFYQVQPIFDESSQGASTTNLEVEPPAYDSGIDIKFTESSPQVDRNPYHALLHKQEEDKMHDQQSYFDDGKEATTESSAPSIRLSSEVDRLRQSITLPEDRRTLPEDRRGSLAFTDTSIGSTQSRSGPEAASAPGTPNEESTAQRLSRAASRFRKSGSKSRPTSSSGENRISATFSRLAARSKEQLNKIDISPNKDIPLIPGADGAVDLRENVPAVKEEEAGFKPPSDAVPTRKMSKRGRKQEKLEKRDKEHEEHHHHHFHHKKDRELIIQNGKQIPERECTIM